MENAQLDDFQDEEGSDEETDDCHVHGNQLSTIQETHEEDELQHQD